MDERDDLSYPYVEVEPTREEIARLEQWLRVYEHKLREIQGWIAVGAKRGYMDEPDYSAVDTPTMPKKWVRAEGPGEPWLRRQLRWEQQFRAVFQAHMDAQLKAFQTEVAATKKVETPKAFDGKLANLKKLGATITIPIHTEKKSR